jgi:ABC-type polysaccharide/polyol phosphate export permease
MRPLEFGGYFLVQALEPGSCRRQGPHFAATAPCASRRIDRIANPVSKRKPPDQPASFGISASQSADRGAISGEAAQAELAPITRAVLAAPTDKQGVSAQMVKWIDNAVADIRAGWRLRAVALAFAAEDVKDIYRRTFLGPLWSVLSFLLFVGSIVLIVGHTSGIPNYTAFVASGLMVYLTMTEVMAESSNLFQREIAFVKGTTLPISIYILRLTTKTVIRSIYPLLAALFLILIDGVLPTTAWFYSALGVLLIILAIPAVATVVSILGVLLPDMHFIVQNILRLAFFLTPVFWDHAGDRIRMLFFYWNPFTHFITIVRSPLLTGDPASHSWVIALAISVVAWILAFLLLGKFRDRIVFLL